MTLVSVVIPAHNREAHLARALESVLAQTYSELEVLVVDDGSEDGTRRIAEEYARKDSRVQPIVHGQKKGAQAARNTGIQGSRGQWIAFLDSDDYWLPDSLEARWQLAASRGPAVVHSQARLLPPGSSEPQEWSLPPLHGKVYKQLLAKPGPMFQSMLAPKEAFVRIDYLDESITSYQEWETAIRLAQHCTFAFLPKPTFVYDCRHANTISKNPLRTAVGYEQVFKKHWWPIFRHLGLKGLSDHYRAAAGYYRQANDAARARKLLCTASLLWPLSSATLEALKELVGEGPHREAWRGLRKRLRGGFTAGGRPGQLGEPPRTEELIVGERGASSP
jgi:glycosyltransferase involved in cell wall biosynthesis